MNRLSSIMTCQTHYYNRRQHDDFLSWLTHRLVIFVESSIRCRYLLIFLYISKANDGLPERLMEMGRLYMSFSP